MKKDVQQFIALLFLSRDFAHKSHLNSKSYSEHVALGSFYDGIVDLADTLVESWQGRNLEQIGDIPTLTSPNGEALTVIRRHLQILEDSRDFIPKEDSALNNIVDEIVALYLSTIYKLKFLK